MNGFANHPWVSISYLMQNLGIAEKLEMLTRPCVTASAGTLKIENENKTELIIYNFPGIRHYRRYPVACRTMKP